MRQPRLLILLLLWPAVAGCARSAGLFSEQNARAHIEMLAGTIGSRPVGTAANARARAYAIDQLELFGFEVRVQEVDARRAEIGRTARVSNIIAIKQGQRREAVGLVAHYDSSPHSPGAADDGLGVAVAIEAGRVLAARPDPIWSVFVLLTDAEESGLMGAAGLVTDREVTERLRAYINLESAGSGSPTMLFETGPDNAWLTSLWARHAPHPRGGSFGLEVYRRLPNDTDFSLFKTQGIPGLNFAVVGDGYAYHTARDTPERIAPATARELGENVVAIAEAIESTDITRRTTGDPTYFDIGGTTAVSYGSAGTWVAGGLALLLGVFAWVRVTAVVVRAGGFGRWLLTAVWTGVAGALVAVAMVGATWMLRAASQVYHPWYARPDRLLFLLLAVGVASGWMVSRAGRWLPERAHGLRGPAVTWTLALPLWIVLSGGALVLAPEASYLWTLPLLTIGALLILLPPGNDGLLRVGSLVALAVAAALWLRLTVDLGRFVVAVFGRLPVVTPIFVYAALLSAAGVMIAPPLLAALATPRRLVRPSIVTALCLLAVAIGAGAAFMAPPYTASEPLRRQVRAIQEPDTATAVWEVASIEPGLDLPVEAPAGWTMPLSPAEVSIPWGMLPQPFVFRTAGPSLGPAPIDIAGFSLQPVEAGVELSVTLIPRRPGLTVSFLLPPGVTPARSSLPGVPRLGRWSATYVAVPADGLLWRAGVAGVSPDRLRDVRVVVSESGFPGGSGWQRLPEWLPQERTVWAATSTWVVAAAQTAALVPVPPLR